MGNISATPFADGCGVEGDSTAAELVVEIVNRQGLHARPIMKFVDLASSFAATITVEKNGELVDGKSPMEMMLLEAPRGSRLHLRASGEDARAMVDALSRLVAGGFGEE